MNDENDIQNEDSDEMEIDDETSPEEAADDVAFEPEDNETPLSSFGKSKGDVVTELREKLKASEAKAAEYLTDLQRMKAEFVNLRKRDEAEKKELVKFSNEKLIDELLPVLDSFEMAFANKEAWEKADKNWRVGVEYIHSQLVKVFEQHGLLPIDPLGEKFDPSRDTPVEMVPTDTEADDHKIVAVIQKGYTLNGKEIRSPKVKVAEFKKD